MRRHGPAGLRDPPPPRARRRRGRSSSSTSTTRFTWRRWPSPRATRDRHATTTSALSIETLNHQIERGDFLICASERQRDLFIGQLCALGRANALTYDADPTLATSDRRGAVRAPGPAPRAPPTRAERVSYPAFGQTDDVLVWAGGIYDWFDPLTLIRAVARAGQEAAIGTPLLHGPAPPQPGRPADANGHRRPGAGGRARGRGHGTSFSTRAGSTTPSARTSCSKRTWASRCTSTVLRRGSRSGPGRSTTCGPAYPSSPPAGDAFAELIEREGLGLTVPAEDPEALEEALCRLLSDWELAERCRARVGRGARPFSMVRSARAAGRVLPAPSTGA